MNQKSDAIATTAITLRLPWFPEKLPGRARLRTAAAAAHAPVNLTTSEIRAMLRLSGDAETAAAAALQPCWLMIGGVFHGTIQKNVKPMDDLGLPP